MGQNAYALTQNHFIMKKLTAICVLIVTAFATSAQEVFKENTDPFADAPHLSPTVLYGSGQSSTTKTPWEIDFPLKQGQPWQADELELNTSKRNRYLVISNSSESNIAADVYKKSNEAIEQWYRSAKYAKGFHRYSKVKVFIKNPNLEEFTSISISIEGTDYTYESTIQDFFNSFNSTEEIAKVKPEADSNDRKSNDIENDENIARVYNYLVDVEAKLQQHTSMTIEDAAKFIAFQEELSNSLKQFKLDESVSELAQHILGFRPTYIALTDFPLSAKDADELTFVIKTNKTDDPEKEEVYNIGPYPISGGVSATAGASVYFTNLSNRAAYADSVSTATGKEYRAFLQESGKVNIGIGANIDFVFRSASPINFLASLGFFVPFEEDITPYVAPGIGVAYASSKVKITVSAGPAFAKVNVLNPRYADRDLSGLNLTNENLTLQQWQTGWQIGLGFSYNLSK